MLFASSFSQVYYNEIAQIQQPKELFKSYTYWLKRLFILTFIGLGNINVFSFMVS